MSTKHRLGDLQFAIMKILWEKGQGTVNNVHQSLLSERGLAPTTIATMLKKMEEKGVVAHDVEGRQFIYRPIVQEEDVTRTMVGELVDRLYGGDALAMVSHLLTERDFDEKELAQLKDMIKRKGGEEGSTHVR
ncbi:MAG: BlaI/MecI/CopY family transcriptional regulator [Planctomycetes bacterium]|nr:BlaI/MecI/CopY family transcriptional regulator [Planctomycetota bacterium]MCH7601334.1 BlaI/MecI/CopY family transcriptional regulator [Planctomycetota bacterium]